MTEPTRPIYGFAAALAGALILMAAVITGFELSALWLPTTGIACSVIGTLWLARAARAPNPSTSAAPGNDLQGVMAQLSNSSGHNAIASAEVSFAIDSLTRALETQVEAISQVQHSASEITATVQDAADSARHAQQSSSEARQISETGRTALSQAIDEMRQINERTGSTLGKIESLDSKIHKIQDVTKVIEDIASQTNLLALNAAIEAARAGEHGRGFAVVADEVRQLAARTATSTHEVGQIVEDILRETRHVVDHIQHLSADVDKGTNEVAAVGEQLEGIADQSRAVEAQIHAIATGTENNRTNLDQILSAISQIQGELSGSEQQMEHLAVQAQRLMEMAETSNALLAEHSDSSYHQHFFRLAEATKIAIEAAFENALSGGQLSEADLFDHNYQPIANTNPQKYTTRFDALCDRILPAIQEPVVEQEPRIIYAIANDKKGYVPTHNKAFTKALTGDYATDFAANRTKRIFNDRTGSRCGAHTQRMLVQTYKRDTGEVMHDLSVPLYVRGKHWGSLRMGYSPQSD